MSPHDPYRHALETGDFAATLAREAPGMRLLSDAERAASLCTTLEQRPQGDLWVFAYGSLLWNPAIRFAERRLAGVEGWHRSFCLTSPHGRGSPDLPGLVLALEQGGCCEGVALGLDEADVDHELDLLWRREMVSAAYIPRWVDLLDPQGRPFGAGLAFTIDVQGANYAGDLSRGDLVNRLAWAKGSLGSSADYLFKTRDGLRACGITDAELEQLAVEVSVALDH